PATAVAAKTTAGTSAVPAVPGPSSGVVAGTVRALGGPGLAGICVTATGPAGAIHGVTSAGGRDVLGRLRPGEYRVDVRDCAHPGRDAEQWYGGTLTADGARPVLVVPGHQTFLRPVTLRPLSGTAFVAASARAMRSKLMAEGRPDVGRPPVLS